MTQQVNPKGAKAELQSADQGPSNYEDAISELEELVARMEGGNLSLEESLSAYRKGAQLVQHCQQQLEKVEQQVQVLDGEMLKPLTPTELGRSVDASE